MAITPDELGDDWRDGKVHLPLLTHLNGALFGAPEAGVDMTFSFFDLIAHAAKTRPLGAGCIIGSGTVSNYDRRYLFTRTGLTASVLPGWDNLSSRCTP